jgi:hypothetical protein
MKLTNLALQGSVVRRRHDLFATARSGQTALRHQTAPSEQLVQSNAMSELAVSFGQSANLAACRT